LEQLRQQLVAANNFWHTAS